MADEDGSKADTSGNAWTTPGSPTPWPSGVPARSAPSSPPPASDQNNQSIPPPPGGFVDQFKPGIIKLAPLQFGELLEGGIKAIRHNPAAVLIVSAVVLLVSQVLQSIATHDFLNSPILTDPYVTPDQVERELADTRLWAGLAIAFVVAWLGSLIITATIAVSTSRSILGEKITPSAAMAAALRRLGPLVVYTVIVSLASALSVALFALLIIGAGGSAGAILGIGFLGTITLGILWIWIGTKLAVTAQVIVLEQVGPIQGMRRSWRLTTNRFWPILGLLIVAGLIVGVAAMVIGVPVSAIGTAWQFSDPASAALATSITSGISGFLQNLIMVPYLGALTAVLYTDLRIRREGFDLTLQQAVQERRGN